MVMGRSLFAFATLLVLTFGASGHAVAATPWQNPNWPCFQRYVPTVSPAQYWGGPPPPAGVNWRTDPKMAAIVRSVTKPGVDLKDGQASLAAFARSISPDLRKAVLPEAFWGIVERINQRRASLMKRIMELAKRQRRLSNQIATISEKVKTIPSNEKELLANGASNDPNLQIMQQRAFMIRVFHETQATMQYACQAPVELEAKLGAYARILQPLL